MSRIKVSKTTTLLSLTVLLLISGAAVSLAAQTDTPDKDPLSFWKEGDAKDQIKYFVNEVCDTLSKHYVPLKYRIAAFDLDGTIGCEIPFSIDISAAVHRLYERASESEVLRDSQPWKSAYNWTKDRGASDSLYIVQHMNEVKIAALTSCEHSYVAFIEDFIRKESPVGDLPYFDLMYLPMLQLIGYLKENKFRVYLVSGSETPCLRAIVDKGINPFYGCDIRNDRIIGSTIDLDFLMDQEEDICFYMNGGYTHYPINVGEAKPINIYLQSGKKPIFAFGNSNGDKEMLKYTMGNMDGYPPLFPKLELLLVHDDPAREFNYRYPDLEKEAKEYGWTLVSMKNDFAKMFGRTKPDSDGEGVEKEE
jgi:hypothetical protein